jgi:lipopolysaccharide export system protein LptA
VLESLTRIIASFVLTAGCYTAYAVVVVPWVEPQLKVATEDQKPLTTEEIIVAGNAPGRQRAELQYWFEEGDWELESPFVLETPEGKVLFRDYRVRSDGMMELQPCSMVFLSTDAASNDLETSRRRATVMRAPEGALLRFEQAINLKQGKFSKLIGGELTGEVEIMSGQKLPGPEDDLLITTRDVKLSETHISTPHLLEYRLGSHRGRGRGVLIELDQEKQADQQAGAHRGMKSMTLQEQVFVHLEPDAQHDMFPGRANPTPSAGAPIAQPVSSTTARKAPSPPIDIRCSGAFTFDMIKNVAVFRKQVDVTRLNPTGDSDTINGDLLTIYFVTPPPPDGTAATIPAQAGEAADKKLQPSRIEITGEPAVVRAPSNRMQARAQYIEHIVETRSVSLRDAVEAIVRQEDREIRCPEITYVPDPKGGHGSLLALGRGKLTGSSPDDPTESFAAEWSDRLHFRPHEGQHVLSLEGGAKVEAAAKGSMAAGQIHLWLKEVPRQTTLATDPAVQFGNNPEPKKPRTELQADRLLALDAVHIESPQTIGDLERLEGWFEHTNVAGMRQAMYPPQEGVVPAGALFAVGPLRFPGMGGGENPTPSIPIATPMPVPPQVTLFAEQPRASGLSGAVPLSTISNPSAPSTSYPATTYPSTALPAPLPGMTPINDAPPGTGPAFAPAPAAGPLPPQSQYHIRGRIARMLINVEGKAMRVREVVVEKNVKLTETKTKLPTELPLLIQGDNLQLTQTTPTSSLVVVTGTPAYVEARGMTLSSGKLTLDRPNPQSNILGVPGQGVMTLPMDKDLQGRPTATRDVLNLTWQGQMTFDGLTARFERGVEAKLAVQSLRTDRMDVTFTRPLTMSQSDAGEPPADIERVNCYDGVFIESRTFELKDLKAVERMTARTLALHRPTGDFAADGPGEVVSIRMGKPQDPNANGPANPAIGNAGVPPIPLGPAAAAKPTINYLNTRFQRSLKGNEIRREMTFSNQVRVLYGPVPDWNGVIDPDRPESWAQQTVLIDADQMQVNAVRDEATQTDSYNLVAEGNTLVEGTTFTARAPRLTYAQSKDLLVIEGDARTDAELHHQKKIGGQNSDTKAQRFMIWPSTNRVQVDGATFLDLTP